MKQEEKTFWVIHFDVTCAVFLRLFSRFFLLYIRRSVIGCAAQRWCNESCLVYVWRNLKVCFYIFISNNDVSALKFLLYNHFTLWSLCFVWIFSPSYSFYTHCWHILRWRNCSVLSIALNLISFLGLLFFCNNDIISPKIFVSLFQFIFLLCIFFYK